MMLALLYVKRSELNPKVTDVESALKERDSDPKLAHLRFLFVEYNGTQWYVRLGLVGCHD